MLRHNHIRKLGKEKENTPSSFRLMIVVILLSSFFLTFTILLLFLHVVGSQIHSQPVVAQAQAQSTILTYENPAIGLKFEYPPEWDLEENFERLTMTPDDGSVVFVEPLALSNLLIPNPTLKDYAQEGYQRCCGTMSTPINDNQTTIGQNYTAQQYEYTFQGGNRQGLVVWVINNGVGYQFQYISDPGSEFSKNLPALRKVLDSVEFVPIEVEEPEIKMPSFMQ